MYSVVYANKPIIVPNITVSINNKKSTIKHGAQALSALTHAAWVSFTVLKTGP